MPNIGYNNFQKKKLWLADKRVDLYVIRIDTGDITLEIQCYDHIPGYPDNIWFIDCIMIILHE